MGHIIKDIKCSVGHCVYNENCSVCTAGNIEVGPSNATCCSDTLCATFKPNNSGSSGSSSYNG